MAKRYTVSSNASMNWCLDCLWTLGYPSDRRIFLHDKDSCDMISIYINSHPVPWPFFRRKILIERYFNKIKFEGPFALSYGERPTLHSNLKMFGKLGFMTTKEKIQVKLSN
jgi:hypothetical protein